jgi:hypothetical protein
VVAGFFHEFHFERILIGINRLSNKQILGIRFAPLITAGGKYIYIAVDKAKPRAIVGRLPAVAGGRPTVPGREQAGKATGPTGIAGLPNGN